MWNKRLLNQFAHEATQRYAEAYDRRTSTPPGRPAWTALCKAESRAHRRMLRWNHAWWDASPSDANSDLLNAGTHEAVQRARKAFDDPAARRDARVWVERLTTL